MTITGSPIVSYDVGPLEYTLPTCDVIGKFEANVDATSLLWHEEILGAVLQVKNVLHEASLKKVIQ